MRTRAAILLAVGAICGVIAAITLRSATDRGTPTAPAAQVAPARQVPAAPAHTPAVDTGRWVASWSAPPLRPGPVGGGIPYLAGGVGGRTVRDVVHLTLGGNRVRIRLSNVFGSRPATFTDVRVALTTASARPATLAGTTRRVRFGGRPSVTVPAGAERSSDPIALRVHPRQNLAVSIYAPTATGIATITGSLNHTNFVSGRGDVAAARTAASFPTASPAWYWLDGVDVIPQARGAGAIVALGDSITAGYDSTPNANDGWVDLLADRLQAAHTSPPLAVLNAGISGNNLHESSPCFGQSGLQRMQRDALAQPGVRDVIVALGVNDITQPHEPSSRCLAHARISAAGMIADYRTAIRRIHADHLRAIGATIAPFGRYPYWSPTIESERRRIDHWIRTSHAFDGVIDFDRALRDPAHPSWLNPAYDSGDGLHPNDAGQAAMAAAIKLSILRGS